MTRIGTNGRGGRGLDWKFACFVGLVALFSIGSLAAKAGDYFGIEILDWSSRRGIPGVELQSVNHVRLVSDSAGLIVMREPDFSGSRVFFEIRAPGYVVQKDEQGFAGLPLEVKPGGFARILLVRQNLAERLYRLTGTGIYRDSVLLERAPPIEEPLQNGAVAGQDLMVATVFRGRVFWFAGDTLRLRHPVGQYWSTGATSELPEQGGLDPAVGVNLHYFVDDEGFARAVWPAPKEPQTAIWTDGLLTVKDNDGMEQMLAHYTRLKSATELQEQGVGLYDPERNQFVPGQAFPPEEKWRMPVGNPAVGRGADEGYWLFPAPALELAPFLAVRARAALPGLLKPESYVAFTYLRAGSPEVERGEDGRVIYGWKEGAAPVGPRQERALIAAGSLSEEDALYQPRDADSGEVVDFRAGSVHWNAYRQKWVMIAEQLGPSGYTGEVYYSEAPSAVGPWRHARKVATHGAQSFYNPAQLPFFDQENGRYIYFIGTYGSTSGAAEMAPTPRYDDNQLMYRLDLADEKLHLTP